MKPFAVKAFVTKSSIFNFVTCPEPAVLYTLYKKLKKTFSENETKFETLQIFENFVPKVFEMQE